LILICSECGSYQPDGIKFCGICGVPLTTDGHISQFLLNTGGEDEIDLPRRRGFRFFLIIILSVLLILIMIAALGYLIYYVTRTEPAPETNLIEVNDEDITKYATPDGAVSFSYPRLWDLHEVSTASDHLELLLQLTNDKKITITSERMDPDLMLGGIEDIRYYVVELIARDLAATRTVPSEPPPNAEKISGDMLSLNLNGQDAYSYKAEIMVDKRPATVIYYFIVSNELLYELRGISPTDIWDELLPDYMVVVGTFRTVQAE
jgi:hypothetical protein